MKHALLATACLSLLATSAFPAAAQPVEAVPLSAPNYTLQTETDPMAMDPSSAATPSETTINRGAVEIAPPPPGLDDQTRSYYEEQAQPEMAAPSAHDLSPQDSAMPSTGNYNANMDGERSVHSYPNNTVSGVVPKDESKFANMTFCTLKVSFSSIGTGIDAKTAERIKTYLDANTDKLSYKTATWGKEGEFDYCVDIPVHNQRARTYIALKGFLPDKDMNDRRTTLSGKGFTQVRTSN